MDALPPTLVSDWKAFFAGEDSRPRGLDVYPELFQHPVLFPLQRMRETAAMMRTAAELNPHVVMEIGADKGGSFYHWIKCHPKVKKAIACEIRGTPYAEEFRRAFPSVEFLFLPESSQSPQAVQKVRTFLGSDSITCLFVDGDKNRFEDDVFLYLPFIRYGGLICLHDVHGEARPVLTFQKLRSIFSVNKTIIDVSEGEEAAARELRGEPVTSSYEGWLRVWKTTSCGVGCLFT